MIHLSFLAALAFCALAGQFLSGPSLDLFNLLSLIVAGLAMAAWFASLMRTPETTSVRRQALGTPLVAMLVMASLIPVGDASGHTLAQWSLSLLA